MIFPKTIFLTINTHGCIKCSVNNNTKTYEYPIVEIPNKINKIIKIDSVPYGNKLFISNKEICEFNKIIKEKIRDININKIEKNVLHDIIIEIKKKTKNFRYKTEKNDKEQIDFQKLVDSDKIYSPREYLSKEKIVNKTYSYRKSDFCSKLKYIEILDNNLNSIDLFDLVDKKIYHDGYQTDLINIINFLSEKGVENIILFDFSCYTFLPKNIITKRTIRNFRREINYKMNIGVKRKIDSI